MVTLTLVASFLVHEFGGTGDVPGYLLVVVGGLSLTVGLVVAWVLTRKDYELRVRLLRTEVEKVQVEVDLERERRESVSQAALRRFFLYSEHVYSLVGSVVSRQMSLSDLAGDDVRAAICEVVQAQLRKGTGHEFKVSVWVEPSNPTLGEKISGALSEQLPAAISSYLPARARFEVVAAPDHTASEREAFAVPIDASWLKWNQRLEDDHDEPRVYKADVPSMQEFDSDDIVTFLRCGYNAVRAIAFRREHLMGYVVVLSQTPHAFAQPEEQYLLWLRRVLELNSVIHMGPPA